MRRTVTFALAAAVVAVVAVGVVRSSSPSGRDDPAAPPPDAAEQARWSDPRAPAAASPTDPPHRGRTLTRVDIEPVVAGRPSTPLPWRRDPPAPNATARCGIDTGDPARALLVEVIDPSVGGDLIGLQLTVSPYGGPGRHAVTAVVQSRSTGAQQAFGTMTVADDPTSGSFDVVDRTGTAITGRWSCTYVE